MLVVREHKICEWLYIPGNVHMQVHTYTYVRTYIQASLSAAEKAQEILNRRIDEQSEALKAAHDELVDLRERCKCVMISYIHVPDACPRRD